MPAWIVIVAGVVCLISAALPAATTEPASAPTQKLKLSGVFGEGMVLQQGMSVPVWGWAQADAQVTVAIAGQSQQATADANGRWMVRLDALQAGGPFELTVSAVQAGSGQPAKVLTLRDVLVGEVWLCSGQSNMQWAVEDLKNGKAEVAAADFPRIRLYGVPCKAFDEPQDNCNGKWAVCSPQTIHRFSAAGYLFGRELHQTLGVPIGLINASWGGTSAEAWTSRLTLEDDADFAQSFENYKKALAAWDANAAQARYKSELAEWEVKAAAAKAEEKPIPYKPSLASGPIGIPGPSQLYNGMIAPLMPMAIRGAIWYQGESNMDRPDLYARLLSAMIFNWRTDWDEGDFSFGIVQLPNYQEIRKKPTDTNWARLREAQFQASRSVNNAGLAVTIDVGEADNIHPSDKVSVAHRLALWALARTYGKDVVYSGPIFKSMDRQDGRIVLHFDHVDGGLVAKDSEELKGFAIAGADQKFVWADAKIDGDTVVVSSEKVSDPVAVRYAWANNPVCNLYNKALLPACPFRTDDWPMPVKKPKMPKTAPATQPTTATSQGT
ncbi:MAG: sialate O-acetylesterase [Phycisphaerae bacterium]|jgi:sialate O-acetylesterase